jgi:neutral amino acid transport system permease protein
VIAIGAVGLTLVYSILKLVNFAHGDFLTLGAYMALLAGTAFGLPVVVGALIGMAVTAALSTALEVTIWRPMRRQKAGLLQLMLISLGIALILRAAIQFAFGPEIKTLHVNVTAAYHFLGLTLGHTEAIVVAVGIVTLGAVAFLLRKSLLGKRMRALSDNIDLAETSGIDTPRVILWTWVFSGGLAGLAGVLAAARSSMSPTFGFELLLPMFAAVVLGGIGDVFGALVAGVMLAVGMEWSTLAVSPEWKIPIGFGILLLALAVRPQGIFGGARVI